VHVINLVYTLQGEIDAREDSFKATDQAGQRLVNADHYAADEVRDKARTTFLRCYKALLYQIYSVCPSLCRDCKYKTAF
jgi:hypothetical protein